jgi:hypothetical protein
MAFVVMHCVSTASGSALPYASRRAAGRLRTRHNLTLQRRANPYASPMPPAVITTSLGGHPRRAQRTDR